jgi:hypothetical protein
MFGPNVTPEQGCCNVLIYFMFRTEQVSDRWL